jgi:hypothetical protein
MTNLRFTETRTVAAAQRLIITVPSNTQGFFHEVLNTGTPSVALDLNTTAVNGRIEIRGQQTPRTYTFVSDNPLDIQEILNIGLPIHTEDESIPEITPALTDKVILQDVGKDHEAAYTTVQSLLGLAAPSRKLLASVESTTPTVTYFFNEIFSANPEFDTFEIDLVDIKQQGAFFANSVVLVLGTGTGSPIYNRAVAAYNWGAVTQRVGTLSVDPSFNASAQSLNICGQNQLEFPNGRLSGRIKIYKPMGGSVETTILSETVFNDSIAGDITQTRGHGRRTLAEQNTSIALEMEANIEPITGNIYVYGVSKT